VATLDVPLYDSITGLDRIVGNVERISTTDLTETQVTAWVQAVNQLRSSFEVWSAPDPSLMRAGMWSNEVVVNEVNAICDTEVAASFLAE